VQKNKTPRKESAATFLGLSSRGLKEAWEVEGWGAGAGLEEGSSSEQGLAFGWARTQRPV
jgi:hypothetical protein